MAEVRRFLSAHPAETLQVILVSFDERTRSAYLEALEGQDHLIS